MFTGSVFSFEQAGILNGNGRLVGKQGKKANFVFALLPGRLRIHSDAAKRFFAHQHRNDQ